MNDLRHDQEEADAATHIRLRAIHATDPEATQYDLPAVKRVDQLRTVPMPDLRSADARTFDAAVRDLRPLDSLPIVEQVDYWSKAIHEATQHLRQLSELMQGGAR